MSEQQANYHYAGEDQKPLLVHIALNSEQVRGVLDSIAQKSPELLIREALRLLARNPATLAPDLFSEDDAWVILHAIIREYPHLAQNIPKNTEISSKS